MEGVNTKPHLSSEVRAMVYQYLSDPRTTIKLRYYSYVPNPNESRRCVLTPSYKVPPVGFRFSIESLSRTRALEKYKVPFLPMHSQPMSETISVPINLFWHFHCRSWDEAYKTREMADSSWHFEIMSKIENLEVTFNLDIIEKLPEPTNSGQSLARPPYYGEEAWRVLRVKTNYLNKSAANPDGTWGRPKDLNQKKRYLFEKEIVEYYNGSKVSLVRDYPPIYSSRGKSSLIRVVIHE
jgi:hypothetical protein